MTIRTYWTGSVFVAELTLTDVDGNPINDATVTGTVATPAGGTAPMVIDHTADTNVYLGQYQTAASGRHGWRMVADGTGQDVVEGEFVVNRSITGALPITVDPTQPVGQVRMLTTDVDEAFPLHTDAQITAFLSMEGDNVKRAAALQLEVIATSETLTSKKISTQDLSVDGPAVAEDLRKRAALLRKQAADADAAASATDTGFGFDFVDLTGTRTSGWL